jgi:O-antigen ligase
LIRLALLSAYLVCLVVYSWKDWYRALCGLILLVGVVEHPDMPKTLLGVQGLNPWNIILLVVLLAWMVGRVRERLVWDMPRFVSVLLLVYLAVVLVGFGRMMADHSMLRDSVPGLWSEYLVNTVKWTIPGLLLFDGARSRERFLWGLAASIGIYVILGIQVIKWMPASSVLSGEDLTYRSLKILMNEVGFHRVNLSMMLGGASWAAFAAHVLPRRRVLRLGLLLLAGVLLYAQALTGGRTGYATWLAVGLVLCVLRWRRYLLAIPVAAVAVVVLMPSVAQRMMQGFSHETLDRPAGSVSDEQLGEYTVTAGRTLIWPYVIDRIERAPAFGYGRQAMQRTGLAKFLLEELHESFPHPHNAYLEMLLDNGWVGFVLVMPFYLAILLLGTRLLLDSRSPVFVAAGGATLALVLALLIAAVGSQTFYPREGAVGMWCVIGLMLRVWVERGRAIRAQRSLAEASPEAGSPSKSDAAAPPARGSLLLRRRRPRRASLDEFLWARAA